MPLWTHGTFDDYKTDIDPDFDLEGELAKAGLQILGEELGKEAGIPVGDILKDIFKKKE